MKNLTAAGSRVALAAVLLAIACPAIAQETTLPKVRVVATGGTIAGEQREPGTLGGYDIKKSVNENQALRKNGVIVATTFPSGEQVGDASPNIAQSALPPVVAVKHLMPTKARILMMLALTKTQKASDIQKIFDSY